MEFHRASSQHQSVLLEVEAVKQISSLNIEAARMKWGGADQSPHRHACQPGIAADFAAGAM